MKLKISKKWIVLLLFIFASCGLWYPFMFKCFFMNIIGIKEKQQKFSYVDSTSACLPVGSALAFVTSKNTTGYVYFEKMNYGQIDYAIVMQNRNMIRGRLSIWKQWPWSKLSLYSTNIYLNGDNYPHFAWLPPFGFLHYDRSKISKVSLIKLSEIEHVLNDKNSNKWINVEYIAGNPTNSFGRF